jgi:arabinose-5-phosphate isomerase
MNNYFNKYFLNHIDGFSYFLENVNDVEIFNLIQFLNKPHRNIFFTGIGKNGHVAAKAASTFNSMGIRVFFINPVDAVHGDMGLIDKDDIILAISKSGNTEELLWFLKNAKDRTDNIFLIHSNKNNNCLQYCQKDLFVPLKMEADRLNKIPTTSIVLYTTILQSICCTLAENIGFTLDQLVFNHPGGSIGKSKL